MYAQVIMSFTPLNIIWDAKGYVAIDGLEYG